MGKIIEEIARQRGHNITHKIDSSNRPLLNPADLEQVDAAIEFSVPQAALHNIKLCFESKTPVVVGTTGWYDDLDEVKAHCHQHEGCLLYASNFSVGVNLLFALNRKLAKWMNDFSEYDVKVEEIHHIHKKDAPSGTAITLSTDIIEQHEAKLKWQSVEMPAHRDINAKETIAVGYSREAEVSGTHRVVWESGIDKLTLSHEAYNRRGFALGAVLASEFVAGKKGVYTAYDLFDFHE